MSLDLDASFDDQNQNEPKADAQGHPDTDTLEVDEEPWTAEEEELLAATLYRFWTTGSRPWPSQVARMDEFSHRTMDDVIQKALKLKSHWEKAGRPEPKTKVVLDVSQQRPADA